MQFSFLGPPAPESVPDPPEFVPVGDKITLLDLAAQLARCGRFVSPCELARIVHLRRIRGKREGRAGRYTYTAEQAARIVAELD